MSPVARHKERGSAFKGPIWQGVYSSFEEVPQSGAGFTGGAWDDAMLEKARLVTERPSDGAPSSGPMYSSSLLPLVLALSGEGDQGNAARILDFGGGPGATFVAVTRGAQGKQVDYHVVEMPNICDIGTRLFDSDPRIRFHSSLPDHLESLDIVHFGSSIQYVRDWKELLHRIARYRPRIMLFTELMAGDIPTDATGQHYYGSTIPMWFFNFEEFRAHLATLGFQLEFRARYDGTYLGKRQPCPQPNFAPEYRLGYASHALFRSGRSPRGRA